MRANLRPHRAVIAALSRFYPLTDQLVARVARMPIGDEALVIGIALALRRLGETDIDYLDLRRRVARIRMVAAQRLFFDNAYQPTVGPDGPRFTEVIE